MTMNSLRLHCILFVIILTACLPSASVAQKMTVESMVPTTDQTANLSENLIQDNNGDYAGLVKVRLAASSASFEGMVLRSQKHNASEYWVFMAKNSTKLTVIAPGCLPLLVNFRDYGINAIESRYTYSLSISMPQMTNAPIDDGMRYLAMTVEPKNSMVIIDGQMQSVENGEVNVLLMMGKHQYQVSAPNFSTKQGVIEIGDGKKVMTVKLESALSTVRVDCATAGAQIYVDGEHKGPSPWNGTLSPGNHRVEARHDGYRPHLQSLILSENENRTISIPALILIAGQLNVNYLPQGAEVVLDGKSIGTTPDVFRNIPAGLHRVEVRKKGCKPVTQTITIKENEQASLSGTLTANSATSTGNADTSGNVSSPRDSGIPSPAGSIGQYGSSESSGSPDSSRETFMVNGVSFTMIRVEGGTFMMGATKEQGGDALPSEKPVHDVTLSTYMIGETEVTQALWQAVMGSNPSEFTGDPSFPVESVSWHDCQDFIAKMNTITGKSFRLPTEAEWEYAARGGGNSCHYKYSGSNDVDEVAWTWNYRKNQVNPVGKKRPNELGLFDMSGNVSEWCSDLFGSYENPPKPSTKKSSKKSVRVNRGGNYTSDPVSCRTSNRSGNSSIMRSPNLGLRLAL